MTDTKYNGWSNWETWNANLWLNNEDSYWIERAQDCLNDAEGRHKEAVSQLEDTLKEYHEENMPELQGMYAYMLNAAMYEVDWQEIAESLLDDLEYIT